MSSDNTETVADRLRRWADESEEEGLFPTTVACTDMEIGQQIGFCMSGRKLFRRLADEIEAEHERGFRAIADSLGKPMDEGETMGEWLDRYYLPRPLFEDGQPVRFGDDFRRHAKKTNDTVSSITYTFGDRLYARINDDGRLAAADRIRRPMPKVLDADGVPIEVWDVGWLTHLPETVKVRVVGIEDDGMVKFHGIYSNEWFLTSADHFTHREPDSQDRIDADALKTSCNYFGVSGKPCDECPIHGSEIGCSNEKSLDLLRRQRELDGRDA